MKYILIGISILIILFVAYGIFSFLSILIHPTYTLDSNLTKERKLYKDFYIDEADTSINIIHKFNEESGVVVLKNKNIDSIGIYKDTLICFYESKIIKISSDNSLLVQDEVIMAGKIPIIWSRW